MPNSTIAASSYEWVREIPLREADPATQCNFCGEQKQDHMLITGPAVRICYDCVSLCNEIFAEKQKVFRDSVIQDIAKTMHGDLSSIGHATALLHAEKLFDAGYRKEVK
ncbi:ClpX C4-type zinc finger protein [Phytobacter diazotrophicus]